MRESNFKKNPHTARFLRTFHDANGANNHPVATQTEAQRAEVAVAGEREAVAFVKGNRPGVVFAQPRSAGEYFATYEDFKVKHGNGLITEKQAKWICDIAGRPSVTEAMRASLAVRLEQGFAKGAASSFITQYKDIPAAPSAEAMEAIAPGAGTEEYVAAIEKPVTDRVREGRYALETPEGIKFYRVTHGKGRWIGRTFVQVQASDDLHRVWAKQAEEILKEIAANSLQAEQRYGRELGKCSRCGRTLTDETSRAFGIGPDCRAKY